jgi:two-component system response regulator
MKQHRQHGLILLVEDNPDDVLLTMRAFERNDLGNRVITRRDGQEALDYLLGADDGSQAGGTLPDVVFLDLKLPRVDGLQVLRRVRAEDRTRYLPVVVLTIQSVEHYWTARNVAPPVV